MLLPRLALAAAVAATATGIGAGAATAADTRPPTEVVVEFDPASTDAERRAALAAMGAGLVETVGDDFAVVEVSSGAQPTGAVLDVDPVAVLTASGTPDDPGFASQWHLRAVQAEAAWDVATGAGVVVAVVDSGVATAAPDLAGVRFVAGRDWVDGGAPDDQQGHGTHVTGTIAQRTNNGVGVAGLAHGATIMPLRVLDADGRGTDAHVAAAIDHAVTNGADVINLSLGGPTSTSVLQAAVARAVNAGVVVVAAAGNTGLPGVSYPAAYPGVVAVGALDSSLGRASFSTFGPQIDIAAPGTSVVQQTFTTPGAWCYCAYSGTSMATPHVAAAAAILLSNGMAWSDVVPALLTSARDVAAPGRDDETGAGLLQVAGALAVASPDAAPATAVPAPAPAPAPASPAPVVAPAPITPAPTDEPTAPAAVQDIDDACPAGSVTGGRFADVDPGLVHARAVDCVAWLGIASGVDASSFAPGAAVTRGQMATFLARLVERAGVALPASAPDAFADDDGTTHEAATNRLAAAGIVRGTGAAAFTPGAPVSRAAMATFLVAVHDLVAAGDLPAAADGFADDDGNVHEAAIDRLAAAGLATGTAATTFSPAHPVTRAQLATFLARVLDAVIDAGDVPAP